MAEIVGWSPTEQQLEPDDVREQISVGVLLPNGRLAGRSFASRAEAEAWARPEDGEQVVEFNAICDCDM
ncbi:hypothetical protein [Isoptericola variabilis]|uniref:hypothetical protein n=1 Tax=Puerhibacterium sp. TATVAM-FAB25 TaxID=3093699 RepID=UPI00085A5910